MVTMLVLYRAPADTEAFEKRYVEGHLPLVGKYQNIKDFSFHKVTRRVMGEFPYEYVFQGTWADKDGWKADLSSDAAKVATADANEFAEGLFDAIVLEQLG